MVFSSNSRTGSWDAASDHCGLVVKVSWKLTSGAFFIKKETHENTVSHGVEVTAFNC